MAESLASRVNLSNSVNLKNFVTGFLPIVNDTLIYILLNHKLEMGKEAECEKESFGD